MTKDDHKVFSFPYPVTPSNWTTYVHTKDYCGPENKWYSRHLSRYICGVDCNLCYWAHDNRYRVGESEDDKDYADYQMLKDQYKAIWTAMRIWNPLLLPALGIATHRYFFCVFNGNDAFNDKSEPNQ